MAEVSEQVRIIIGQIGHPVCAGRIARHGARLGLGVLMVAQTVGAVGRGGGGQGIGAAGPAGCDGPGCSLGPREVWVEWAKRRVLL